MMTNYTFRVKYYIKYMIMNQKAGQAPWKKLMHFARIIWIDNNSDLKRQKAIFKDNYGCQLEHCKSIDDAKLFMNKRKGKKFLIVCSSRLLDQVIKSFQNYEDCYQKYIVFCGSPAACQRFDDRPQVYKAQCEQYDVINRIQQLEKLINKSPRIIWLIKDQRDKREIYKQKQIISFLNKMEDIKLAVQFFEMGKLQNELKQIDKNGFKTRIVLDNRNGNQYQQLISKLKLIELKNLESIYEIVNKDKSNQIWSERQRGRYGTNYHLVQVQQLRQVPACLQVQYKISILKIDSS